MVMVVALLLVPAIVFATGLVIAFRKLHRDRRADSDG
jgi:ABC-type spermidine/putrescine transport system permease subunit II